nr:basic salivary proline-rich protein 4-like [Aegilops tauschii subsp. strangulata]
MDITRHPPGMNGGTRRVTAPEPKKRQGFLPHSNPTAQRTGGDQPDRRPPPCANADAPPPMPPHCEQQDETKRTKEKRPAEGEAASKPNGREPPAPPSWGRPEPPAPSR